MTYNQPILIFTDTEKPKNCNIVIKDFTAMCQVSVNQKQFDILNEEDKIKVYAYLKELEEKINELGKICIIIKEEFND